MDEALAEMEGSTIGDMFDFLSKEIIRLQVGIPQVSFRHNKLVQ